MHRRPTLAEKRLRRCRWCKLILDDNAPMNAELVGAPGADRKTRAHCPSPTCDWCQPCMRRRHFEIQAATAELPPDPAT